MNPAKELVKGDSNAWDEILGYYSSKTCCCNIWYTQANIIETFSPMEWFHYLGKSCEARKMPMQQNWYLYYETIKTGLVTVSTLPQNHSSHRVLTLCPCNGVCWGSKLGSKERDEINCYKSPHINILCKGRQMYPTITLGSEWKVHWSQTDPWHPSFLKRDLGFNNTITSRQEFSLPRNTFLF